MKVLLLQLFWLSFAGIGAAEIMLYVRLKRAKNNAFLSFLLSTHPVVAVLVLFAVGLSSFALLIVPSIFLELPVMLTVIGYLVMLLGTAVIFFKERVSIRARLASIRITRRWLFIGVVVALVLVIDYFMSMHTGAQLDGDEKFELAQITLFAHKYMSIADPIFGDKGIPSTVYSASILHGMHAVAVKLLRESAAWVVFYSYAFFRLVMWLSFFALAWEFLDKKVRSMWAYAVLVLVPFLYTDVFREVQMHNKIVLAWTAIFIIGTKLWLEKGNTFLLLVGAVLVSSTHPLTGLMATGMITLILVLRVAMRSLKLEDVKAIAPTMVILLLPIALHLYYPHGVTEAGFNDSPFSGPAINIRKFGPFATTNVHLGISTLSVAILALAVAFEVAALKLLKDARLRILSVVLVTAAVLTVYDARLTSLIGYGYLIYKTKNKYVRSALILIVLYAGLVIYNPLILTLANGRVPLWVLSRFHDFNVFGYIAHIIGLMCIAVLPLMYWGYKKLAAGFSVGVVVIYALIVPMVYLQFTPLSVRRNYAPDRRVTLNKLEALRTFAPQLEGQVIMSDDPNLPSVIPGVVPANVFSIDNEANAHPAVHIAERKACVQALVASLNASDLHASGVTAIITEQTNNAFNRLLASSPDVVLTAQSEDYAIYAVKQDIGLIADPLSVCLIPG